VFCLELKLYAPIKIILDAIKIAIILLVNQAVSL